MLKTLFRWVTILVVASFAMTAVQWLVTPVSGASSLAMYLTRANQPRLGKALLWVNGSQALRFGNSVCQNVINAPRNQLLRDLHFIDVAGPLDFYPYERGEFDTSPSARDAIISASRTAFLFGVGTVVVYLPLILGVAFIRASGWEVMKKRVLVALVVFAVAAAIFLVVSRADRDARTAMILTALSLLTAAAGITWTPLLTRRSRAIGVTILLFVLSGAGMLAITEGSGPSDLLSYSFFFGWSLVVLLLKGGAFLLMVAIIVRIADGSNHHNASHVSH